MTKEFTPEAAYRYATGRCARAELCRADLRPKLLARGLAPDAPDALLDRLERERYIDERRYAAAFVHDRMTYNRWGRLKVQQALRMKGISDEAVRDALSSVGTEAYAGQLAALLAAKRRTVRAASAYELRTKLLRFAASRGFELSLAADAVDRLVRDEEGDGF